MTRTLELTKLQSQRSLMSNERYLSILEEIKKHGGDVDVGKPNDKVLIIDGLNTFIRVFSVIPTTNDDGVHVGGIVGFLKSIGYSIKMLGPTRCIVIFDGKGGSTRRRKIYPEYKQKRKTKVRLNRSYDFSSMEDERHSMLMQLSRCVEYLEKLPLTVLSVDSVEADDVIAYITEQVLTESKVTIMSTDKDFLQLVDDRVSVWSPTKKKLYTPESVKEEYEIASSNFIMYRVLDGDKSDNISGIKGFGLKTIIKKFPLLLENKEIDIDELKDYARNNEVVLEDDVINRNYKLMQLKEVDISANAKLKISTNVNKSIPPTAKMQFEKMFIEDRLFSTFPNLNSWLLTTWTQLNRYAEMTNG